MEYTIRYRIHRSAPMSEENDTKEETIIRSDGSILIRRYDHHGPDGHYRLIERGVSSAPAEEVSRLYEKLLETVCRHKGCRELDDDTDAEVILEEKGMRISADARLYDDSATLASLIENFMQERKADWQMVRHQ